MTYSALSEKEVICTCDGARLGYIKDLELDPCGGRVLAYLLPDNRFFNFRCKMRYRVALEWVEKMGKDLILVCRYEQLAHCDEKGKKDC